MDYKSLTVDLALQKLRHKINRFTDVGNAAMEIQILGHHQNGLGEVQCKQTDEAFGIHNHAAVFAMNADACLRSVGESLNFLQFFDVVKAFFCDHGDAPFIC